MTPLFHSIVMEKKKMIKESVEPEFILETLRKLHREVQTLLDFSWVISKTTFGHWIKKQHDFQQCLLGRMQYKTTVIYYPSHQILIVGHCCFNFQCLTEKVFYLYAS